MGFPFLVNLRKCVCVCVCACACMRVVCVCVCLSVCVWYVSVYGDVEWNSYMTRLIELTLPSRHTLLTALPPPQFAARSRMDSFSINSMKTVTCINTLAN